MIKDLGNEMRQFVKDIKKNIKNPEEQDYLLKRSEKLFNKVFEEVENIMNFKENEMSKLEEKQKEQTEKIHELEIKMQNLYKDIYEEEEFFEINCPYCNFEFEVGIDETDIEICCPECQNIIELDWDENNNELDEE